MSRRSFTLLFILTVVTALPIFLLKINNSFVYATDYVMDVEDALFAFGWTANPGEKWLVQGEIILLNSKALVTPTSTPIERDAGSPQENLFKIYLNNVGFYFGWSANISERYRPSTSIIVGVSQAFSNKGPIEPPNAPINEDAGSDQENPALIYLNGIGFHFGWSANGSDRYRPSPTLEVGPIISYSNKALINPIDWAIGIDITPPYIDIPAREPSGDVMPDQLVKIYVSVTDAESGVKNVTLSYTINNYASWSDVPMIYNQTLAKYEATIPGQTINTRVKYKIIAYDNYENSATRDGTEPYFVYTVIPEFASIFNALLMMLIVTIAVILRRIFLGRHS